MLVCGQPQSLLDVLQQTLTPQIFSLLLQKLDLAQEKIRSHVAAFIGEKTGNIYSHNLVFLYFIFTSKTLFTVSNFFLVSENNGHSNGDSKNGHKNGDSVEKTAEKRKAEEDAPPPKVLSQL